jgi:hypothetical protein
MLHPEGSDFDAVKLCCKREKEPECIPVRHKGMLTDPFDMGEILIKELMDARG